MILAIDVGNTQVHGGLFDGDELALQFRRGTSHATSSDEFGVFLRSVLQENGADPKAVRRIAFCSVVPGVDHALRNACLKYFKIQPFALEAGVKTGLKIKYRNPIEVGADRIADAIAASRLFPRENLIVIDLGTATTFSVITAEREYLGGLILPGLRISMEALETRTAKLPAVEIAPPEELIGRSTVESIRSGLYYGTLCALQGLAERIRKSRFPGAKARVVGTGGFSRLYEKEAVFDSVVPELVLIGLKEALKLNS